MGLEPVLHPYYSEAWPLLLKMLTLETRPMDEDQHGFALFITSLCRTRCHTGSSTHEYSSQHEWAVAQHELRKRVLVPTTSPSKAGSPTSVRTCSEAADTAARVGRSQQKGNIAALPSMVSMPSLEVNVPTWGPTILIHGSWSCGLSNIPTNMTGMSVSRGLTSQE